ncbi:IS5-like element ISCysp16 family transposase [Crocosphaera chwakensis]|uniref:Putative transposase n=3 Tax=Crocosphaera chwakensis CCY0110 TaxID=391612 RepID=A3IKH2_9CHRO|nr:IS5-like element ISCysp16 family transposase [Crocosphaera chwakensis]EAZ89087.1 putative transposase [Crocosphaera chwakensis CCY0110]EAZ92453.1 putative transposase [Crocosphaera chwakensis CCY0110]EAZ93161.1 putative transposase [Crocosphaera chwakensis CCY0110]
MYRKEEQPSPAPENFELPFEGKLSPSNRWVIMAELIPWDDFEEEYAKLFSAEKGAPAKPFRMALGILIIKEKLGTSDRETIEQIRENPYLQYFIGLNCYQQEPPVEASMLVHFRKRIDVDLVNKINKEIVKKEKEKLDKEIKKKDLPQEKGKKLKNRGKLILDATCAPADIKYPTDLGILNQARIETERIIDNLYKALRGKLRKKPRISRHIARKEYLKVAKKGKVSYQERRKAIEKQLKYVKNNLGHIEDLNQAGASLKNLSKRQQNLLETIKKVYKQQRVMWENKTQSVPQRIVSLTQPHIRPIVRGKAGKPIEFGAKLSVSCVDNYVFLDRISWENLNESCHLKEQVEKYREMFGYYPESVHVDKIYRTRENRNWCKERGIRISGPKLGRPPKNVSEEEKKQARSDESFRNAIEGKFGQAKSSFSLNLVMTKLPETSETSIAITFLVVNLSRLLRQFLSLYLWLFINIKTDELFNHNYINENYIYSKFIERKIINWQGNYRLLAA